MSEPTVHERDGWKPTIVVNASDVVAHGRPRDVLRKIEDFLRWQDEAIAATEVEVDGEWYVPAWIFEG